MRAINHAVTGAVIGLVVTEPLIAMPVAFLSHFVLDVIPHYGPSMDNVKYMKSKTFKNFLYIDAALCFILVIVLAASNPVNWLLAAVCAFLAAAPDFLSVNRYVSTLRKREWKPSLYSKFATGIQWFERPIGGVVEIIWFVGAVILLIPLLS